MKNHYPNIYDIKPPFEKYYEPIKEYATSIGCVLEIDIHTSPPLRLFIKQQDILFKTIHISSGCELLDKHNIKITGFLFSISAFYDMEGKRYLYSKDIKKLKKMPSLEKTLKLLDYSWDELSQVKREDLRIVSVQQGML